MLAIATNPVRGKSTTQSYRTPVYYVDLTLRDGVNFQQAIQIATDIDQQSKTVGFNQNALDAIARLGLSNAQFEVGGDEVLEIVEEFYVERSSEVEQQPINSRSKIKPKLNQDNGFVQDIKEVLQQSVSTVN